jgi:N-acetylneuraminate synthase
MINDFPKWYKNLDDNNLEIDNLEVNAYTRPKIIAEIGINHGGSLDLAKKLAELAASNGADIIKTQIHRPNDEMSKEAKKVIPSHTKESIFKIIEDCSLSVDEEIELAEFIRSLGKPFLSTPFSLEAVDFLEKLNISAFKIGSGECNHIPMIEKIAKVGKPVILSTGMNNISSIKKSYKILKENGINVVLMHTTNIYPTPPHLVRLEAIRDIMISCGTKNVGLSDHTTSNISAIGGFALGATIVERHFTDDKSRIGADISSSMTPAELKELVKASDELYKLRWGDKQNLIPEEDSARAFAFATAVASKDIQIGDCFSSENITWKRPGIGYYKPMQRDDLFNKKAKVSIKLGNHIKLTDTFS